MTIRNVLACLFLFTYSQSVRAQEFERTLVRITEGRPFVAPQPLNLLGLSFDFGTGFCLDPSCRFIGTNYHVAKLLQPRRIKGQSIIEQYFATGPDDRYATPNRVSTRFYAYAAGHDLAIYKLRNPVRNYHGAAYSLADLEPGEEVDIYAFPATLKKATRPLRRLHGQFKSRTTSGLLAFEYSSSDGKLEGGSSGGVVVERKSQKIVGVLSGVGNQRIALAVPVSLLAEFLKRVQPYLAYELFPSLAGIPPITSDLNPMFVPAPANALTRRPEEPAEVVLLRAKAQMLANSMANFVAVETFAWSTRDKPLTASAEYEVRMIGGVQKYRSYPDGERELDSPPAPNLRGWVLPADEWSDLIKMVGNEYKLKISQAPDTTVNGERLRVFQYYASVEDDLCPFEPVGDWGFSSSKPVAVACYGEVWTDSDLRVLRMSENLDLSAGLKAYHGWQRYRVVVTYGPLERGTDPPQWVPVTIVAEAQDKKRTEICQGQFTDYRRFSASSRLLAENQKP